MENINREDFEEAIVNIGRVTKVVKGGRRFRFTALVVVGDKKGNLHWINTASGKFIARAKGDPAGYSVEPEISGRSIYAIGKGGVLSRFTN